MRCSAFSCLPKLPTNILLLNTRLGGRLEEKGACERPPPSPHPPFSTGNGASHWRTPVTAACLGLRRKRRKSQQRCLNVQDVPSQERIIDKGFVLLNRRIKLGCDTLIHDMHSSGAAQDVSYPTVFFLLSLLLFAYLLWFQENRHFPEFADRELQYQGALSFRDEWTTHPHSRSAAPWFYKQNASEITANPG